MKIYECATYSQLIPFNSTQNNNKNIRRKIEQEKETERKYRSVKNFIFMSTDEMLTISHSLLLRLDSLCSFHFNLPQRHLNKFSF